MVSPRKLTANRANAKRSTGPRSAEGKAAASHNALKHGLAVLSVDLEPARAEIERLAHAILKDAEEGSDNTLARRIAEAQVDLNRVREARSALLSQLQAAPTQLNRSRPRRDHLDKVRGANKALLKFHPHSAQEIGSLNRMLEMQINATADVALKYLQDIVNVDLDNHDYSEKPVTSDLDMADRIAQIGKQLLALDRYERRALSRRKFAIREFDRHRLILPH